MIDLDAVIAHRPFAADVTAVEILLDHRDVAFRRRAITAPAAGLDADDIVANFAHYTRFATVVSRVDADTVTFDFTAGGASVTIAKAQGGTTTFLVGGAFSPVALTSGAAQLGPMSREMKSSEVAAFAGKFGHKPTKIPVAIDALAVFVHKDNPVKGLSLSQVDGIFSSTRKRGASAASRP